MPRVRSDEFNGDGDENIHHHQHIYHHENGQKSPSPIGAGLPLLSRLRLLKEKQVRKLFQSLLHNKKIIIFFKHFFSTYSNFFLL